MEPMWRSLLRESFVPIFPPLKRYYAPYGYRRMDSYEAGVPGSSYEVVRSQLLDRMPMELAVLGPSALVETSAERFPFQDVHRVLEQVRAWFGPRRLVWAS